MQKLLITVCLSVVTAVFAMGSVIAGSVSAGRDGVSVGGVSAGRGGASVSGGGSSVSAGRGGASVSSGGSSVTAGRGGASVGGGASMSASAEGSAGSVNARGDREYDDLGSWMEDLGRWWSGDKSPPERTVSSESTSNSSSEQVSRAEATSSDGEPAVAEARNSKVTDQN